LSAAACGDDESNPVPIRGSERLAWNQAADSPQQIKAFTFKIYVDNAASSLIGVACGGVATAAGYECSGGLPPMGSGIHVLKLASVLNGAESARSAPLRVQLTASTQVAVTTPSELESSSINGTTACTRGPAPRCYDVRAIATGLDAAMALTPTPDGRLLFVEGGRTVRVIAGGRLLSDPALSLSDTDPDARIVGMAVDQDFASTRSVFVAWTEETRTGGLSLNVTRYRELQNTLGEGATIVTGLPFSQGTIAPMAIDGDGLLYVAMPAVADSSATSDRLQSGSGVVMRFTRDGFVPRENPRASPIVANGYALPTGLAIDPTSARVWLSGSNPAWPDAAVATFAITSNGTSSWPIQPMPLNEAQLEQQTTLAFVKALQPQKSSGLLMAGANRLFSAAVAMGGQLGEVGEVRFAAGVNVLAATQDSNGVTYIVATDDATAATRTMTSILQLSPR
jgi:hypothetical protein